MGSPVGHVVYILAATVLVSGVHALTTGDLLPYGAVNGDSKVQVQNEETPHSSPWLSIGGALSYGDQQMYGFRVGGNGYINLCPHIDIRNCTDTSELYVSYIQPYFYSYNSSKNTVWYRNITNTELSVLTNQIRDASHVYGSFTAARGLVATWDEVRRSGVDKSLNNTFQAGIVTSQAGTESFVILSYAQLMWSSTVDVVIQLNNKNDHKLPVSSNGNTTPLTHKSNTGTPGRWVFRVSGTTVESGED